MNVSAEVSEERIANLLCSAWEGGSHYWVRESSGRPYAWRREEKPGDPDYGRMWLNLPVTVTEDEGGVVHTLDQAAIERGLKLMAEKWGRHFGDFMSENDDATTADVFLQLCLLGDIVYG